MFETGFHRWLQSFNAPLIEYIMRGINIFGEEEFLAFLILAAIFGVERRKGFLLAQTLLWTAIVTSTLKSVFALPRPVDVDSLVRDVTGERNVPTPFTDRGTTGFFDLLPPDVVAYFRAVPAHISYGFPSGHSSTSIAVTGSAAILWRRPWLLALALAMVVLMPLSRMYLGRHFLADVLGGLLIGFIAVFILILIIRDAPTPRTGWAITITRIAVLFALPATAVAFLPTGPANEAAMLLGINVGQAWSSRMLPPEHVTGIGRRALVVCAAGAAFIVLLVVIRLALKAVAGAAIGPLGLAGRVLTPCGAIYAGSLVSAMIIKRSSLK
jgi:membrane-associated phospholipid phosphatase